MTRFAATALRTPVAFALGAALGWSAPAAAQTVDDPRLRVEVFGPEAGIDTPTGLRFLARDDAFVIEKNTGKVKRVQDDRVSEVLDLDVSTNAERGLLGIELHPDFETNGYVYLYYSERSVPGDGAGSWAGNRLSRFEWDGNGLTADADFNDFFISSRQGAGNGPNHDGGPLRFGSRRKALPSRAATSTADDAEQNFETDVPLRLGRYRWHPPLQRRWHHSRRQSLSSGLHGGAFDSLYAYGVRNGFGMAFDPKTDQLWDTENGPSIMDEINLVDPGFNSGWDGADGARLTRPRRAGPRRSGRPGDEVDLQRSRVLVSRHDRDHRDRVPRGLVPRRWTTRTPCWWATVNTGNLYLFELNENRDGFEAVRRPGGPGRG